MKKVRAIVTAVAVSMSIVFAGQMPAVSAATVSTVNLFEGEVTASPWCVAASIDNSKYGGKLDTSVMNDDGYFYVEYTGVQDGLQLILQSWSGGESWVTALPSETGVTEDNHYYAKFDAKSIKEVYTHDYSTIDKIHVWSVNGQITLDSIDYVTGSDSEDVSGGNSGSNNNDGDNTGDITQSGLKEGTYLPTEDNVNVVGRTYSYKDSLWCALSGSGAEYTFTGTKCEVTILGDNVAASSVENQYARVAIYVNGERVVDELMKDAEKTFKVFESEEAEDVDVRIVKLSESANSTMGIKNIKVTSKDGIKPVEKKEHSIEFIGDSITCGYGVDDDNCNNHFSTATEDFTKSYAYKTAKALDADYSAVSYSGYGIISGYTTGDKVNTLVPDYYDKLGFSYGYFNGEIAPDSVKWDFEKAQPDVIVVNLGTNDSSYCGSDEDRRAEFTDAYADFLKDIRSHNPNAKILCTLGIMGDSLYGDIESAAAKYTEETGDANVACMKFDVQLYADGWVADYHPTEITHTKAAAKLTDEIKELMGW